MRVSVIGMGTGGGTLTVSAVEALRGADAYIGAKRLMEHLPSGCGANRHVAVMAEGIAAWIVSHKEFQHICVLVSGDAGFYSGAKKLLPLLDGVETAVYPGISSVAFFAAKLQLPWEDWKLISAHGRAQDVIGPVRDNEKTFFLTGNTQSADGICKALLETGLGACIAAVGERLGETGECVVRGTVEKISKLRFDALSVLLIHNPAPRKLVSAGLPDEAFLRGGAPMTKSEVRSAVLSKLRLQKGDTFFDIGAGTGSVSIEAALLLSAGHVYAVEQEADACELIQKNEKQFHIGNLTIVPGRAPEALAALPMPDAAFIGGAGGRLFEILAALLEKNPRVRIVVSAVTLETIGEATAAFKELPIKDTEVVQLSVSRTKQLDKYQLLQAQNPVFLFSGVGNG